MGWALAVALPLACLAVVACVAARAAAAGGGGQMEEDGEVGPWRAGLRAPRRVLGWSSRRQLRWRPQHMSVSRFSTLEEGR